MKFRNVSFCRMVVFLMFGLVAVSCNGWEHQQDRKTKRVSIAANEVHNGWYFAGGDEVVIEGTVNGDAYVAGGYVEVDGTINGDLLVAGGMVTINGKVSDHVRGAGGTIFVQGEVGKDITVAGGTVRIGHNAVIAGNMLAAGGSLDISGTVAKQVRIAFNDAAVNGSIHGDLEFAGNHLSVPAGGHVLGNVKAVVKEKDHVVIADGSVTGNVDIAVKETKEHPQILGHAPWQLWLRFFWFLGLIFAGMVIVILFPSQLRKVGATIITRWGDASIWGILAIVATPVVVMILFVTLVGIPAAIFILTVFLWLLYLSQFALGIVIAEKLFRLEGKGRLPIFGALLVGMIIVEIAVMIPYLGVLVCLAGCILGVGSVLLVAREMWQKP